MKFNWCKATITGVGVLVCSLLIYAIFTYVFKITIRKGDPFWRRLLIAILPVLIGSNIYKFFFSSLLNSWFGCT